MVEFHEGHVVLVVLFFALMYKIVYMALIIDDGANVRDIINIITDICILCVGMRFVWVSYHKSISDKIEQTNDLIKKSIAASKKENEDRIAASKKENEDRIVASKKENDDRIEKSKKENDDRIAANEKENRALLEAIKIQGDTLSRAITDNTMQYNIQRGLYANDIEKVCNNMVSLNNSVEKLDGSVERLGERVRTELRTISTSNV